MDTIKSNSLGIGEPLMNLIQTAVEKGLAVRQGQDSFVAFALSTSDNEQAQMTVLATETTEEAITTARWIVAHNITQYYVLAFDGFIAASADNIPRTAAVHVEAYDRDQDHGMQFSQRYTPGHNQEPVQRLGNLLYRGTLPRPTVAEYGPIVERYERERQKAKEVANDED